MIDPQNGYWLLPSRRRPESLKRFFAAAVATGTSTPGQIIIHQDDWFELRDEYRTIKLPEGWSIGVSPCEGYAAKCQWAWELMQRFVVPVDWGGVIADDNVPETQQWDARLIERLTGANIVASADGWQSPPRMQGAIAFSADLLRAVGYLFPPGLGHLYADDVWETIAKETGCALFDEDVMVRHVHASLVGKSDSTVDTVETYWHADAARFDRWQATEKAFAVSAVASLHISNTPTADNSKPDLSGISLQIATPCGDGKYERVYVRSWFQTIMLLRELGATVDWAEMPYCADVAFARNRLISNFHRGQHTHLLWIDSDMGWQPNDVVRMLLAKRDFVAVAGPKKIDIPQFCVSNADESGRRKPIHHEVGTGLIQVTEVGGAFVLLTRAAVDRMVQHYPELAFKAEHDRLDFALFDPLIENGFRLGEDFAFCRRWRAIGGKIYVLADAPLQHVGSKTWVGAWMDTFKYPEPDLAEAAE